MTGVTFFLVGAAKSATTALYHALRQHEDVYLPAVKEPHFYAYLADPSVAGHLYPDPALARASYRSHYAALAGQRAVGDASTTNLVVPGAAAAIAADVPTARIVAILRHPVDRAFSHWSHFVAAGAEPMGFAEAVGAEADRPFTYRYLGWSAYATQLAPFYERFGGARILVHLYDDLCDDGPAVVRSTLRFLGVDDEQAVTTVARRNELPIPRFPALQRALDGSGRAGPALRRVTPQRARRAAAGWAATRLARPMTLDPALRAELGARFSDEIGRLEKLIGRDLSAWR